MTLHAKPIARVLSRHNLLIGGEREPVLVSALVCGGVALSSMTLIGFGVCGALWVCSLAVWRWMAKADPQMTLIYQRSLRFRGFYPAYSRPYRRS